MKPLTEAEQADALREIAAEALRLRDVAKHADAGMLAFLLENLLHEARAELGKRGLPVETEPPPEGGSVVRLK